MRRINQDISEFSSATFSDKMGDSNTEQMPQEQLQSVKQNQNPNPESSQEDRNSTVTACVRNDAIRDPTHEDGKDLQKARYSQSGCCQDCQRSSQSLEPDIKKAMVMQAEAEHRRSDGDQQSEINLARGKQQDCDSVEQHPSVQDPGAHGLPK